MRQWTNPPGPSARQAIFNGLPMYWSKRLYSLNTSHNLKYALENIGTY